MVVLSDLVLLARSAAGRVGGVAGNTITIALATLAEGLQKAGGITIRANSSSPTTVAVANVGGGTVTLGVSGDIVATGDLGVDGNVEGATLVSLNEVDAASTIVFKNNGTTHSITLTGSPTGNRTVTFPDADVTIGAGSNYLGSLTRTAIRNR